MKSILRFAAVVLLSINPVHAGKKYCEKKGSTEADCLALKAGKKCVWADEACVKDPDAVVAESCKGMKGKEKKKCKKCKGKKGKAKEKCEGKDSK
ncbi:hypothetical protein SO694_00155057 [Aureococcus anophagefferens]|uniref:Uncharacterized protein n=1 Tax=Aureococcus anophagefferens TaxID=44056 RepID=A0ABR1G0U1_AURAN